MVNALSWGLVLTVLTLSWPSAQITRKVTLITLEERQGNIISPSESGGFLQIKVEPQTVDLYTTDLYLILLYKCNNKNNVNVKNKIDYS